MFFHYWCFRPSLIHGRYWASAELFSVLESSLGIVFVCVPAAAPLLSNISGTSIKNSDQRHRPRELKTSWDYWQVGPQAAGTTK
jgi:hypothetical protein